MKIDLAALPTDVSLLHRLMPDAMGVIEQQRSEITLQSAKAKTRDLEIEKLSAIIAKLKRMQFGKSSE